MIQNSKVITENEFMQRRKIILLRAVATLKRLGGNESLIEEIVEKARRNDETMLNGLLEKLTELQSGYPSVLKAELDAMINAYPDDRRFKEDLRMFQRLFGSK